MTAAQRGFLLLSSHLGDPQRRCLTGPQLRELARRVQSADLQPDFREMELADLIQLGYGAQQGAQILTLLRQEAALNAYLRRAEKLGLGVLSRGTEAYPQRLRRSLGLDAPGCLWYKGDLSLLDGPRISLVGSRDLNPENEAFARQAGLQAAAQGFTLVSGNARGADQTAQEACLEAGGRVISIVADDLPSHRSRENVLYLCEDSFDFPFSGPRALSRNRVIHALSPAVLVAQSSLETGGTWDGTTRNLRKGWSRVFCFDDGHLSTDQLCQLGAAPIQTAHLADLPLLCQPEWNLFSL